MEPERDYISDTDSAVMETEECFEMESFPQFCKLPVELQLRIWKFAVPDPRDIESAITMIVNLDLNNPKAILPSLTGLSLGIQVTGQSPQSLNLEREWIDFDSRQLVYNIMNACHLSRKVTREIYRLELKSTLPNEDTALWDPEGDIVLFLLPRNRMHIRQMLRHLLIDRDEPSYGFETLHHLAFCLTSELITMIHRMEAFDAISTHRIVDDDGISRDYRFSGNFPAMQSLTLLCDPGSIRNEFRTGSIVLFPPYPDTRIYIADKTPVQLEMYVRNHLERYYAEENVPIVDVLVMGHRNTG